MKVYSYSQARQNLSKVLTECRSEDILIRRRGGEIFRVSVEPPTGSPFDVKGVKTKATTEDILRAVREGRERWGKKAARQAAPRSPSRRG